MHIFWLINVRVFKLYMFNFFEFFVLFFERTARELRRDFYLTRKRETKILQETPRPSALTRRPVLRMNKTNRVKQPLPQLEKQKKKETATTLKKLRGAGFWSSRKGCHLWSRPLNEMAAHPYDGKFFGFFPFKCSTKHKLESHQRKPFDFCQVWLHISFNICRLNHLVECYEFGPNWTSSGFRVANISCIAGDYGICWGISLNI